MQKFELGQIVYHRSIYEHKEPLKIVGILEDKLLLEGDFSGGTHNVIQRDWFPIKGISRICNHMYKKECRESAIAISTLAIPINENHDNMTKTMFELLHMVLVLTSEIELNPEYE